jgi:hypothetical protein
MSASALAGKQIAASAGYGSKSADRKIRCLLIFERYRIFALRVLSKKAVGKSAETGIAPIKIY